ncbi:MAG: hypothetical protein ACI4JW_01830 [Oscillospiraceae bacterium]
MAAVSAVPKGSKKRKTSLTAMTVFFLALSAAAIWAEHYLSKTEQSPEKADFCASYIHSDGSVEAENIKDGATFAAAQAVKIDSGEGYVRFRVEIADSDGTPLAERISEKQQELEELKGWLDPESPSYAAFLEGYHKLMTECNMLSAKGSLALETLVRDESFKTEQDGGELSVVCENLSENVLYQTAQLDVFRNYEKITTVGQNTDFVEEHDPDNPFVRTYTFKDRLGEGESCVLFTNIVIPSDWKDSTSEVLIYQQDDNGNFMELNAQISDLEIIGDGFTVRVSAEAVDAEGSKSAQAAFAKAEVVTPLDSDQSE